ncbi:MAG: BsaWI family type II restriction enzyme [Dictyoglomaceae bacterium]
MKKGFGCKKEIFIEITNFYDEITKNEYKSDYLKVLNEFESISEDKIRLILDKYYSNLRTKDQAWKTCKGALYEYSVFKFLTHIVNYAPLLKNKIEIITNIKSLDIYREQIVIKNWVDIFPDVDMLIVDKESNKVKAILSCKTSLRERLTETAFWKRELEKIKDKEAIKIFFITTDKDDELRIETNRYIILHVIDYTFITDPQKYYSLINLYKSKYGKRKDFYKLIEKVKPINYIEEVLINLFCS